VGQTAHPRNVRLALAVAFGVCLVGGTLLVVATAEFRTPYTNVGWQVFLGGYFLTLAAVAAVGLAKPGARVAALGGLSGGAAATGFILVFSVGLLVILAALPLWIVTAKAAQKQTHESVALLCSGLAFVALLLGLMTLYHH
jgi:hypothetical protein